ncbi:MAG: nucleoside triphosphate pyrophosphohydrolase [Chloroflexi bacterium]|nr:nucleoside triphosphate pyrophosphohydrolase [Chloroflexota bacterium]MCI0580467.1 nucleoside triphosphate pyrophosphohydrolase [Chloroflexota bacterium]MCI0649211.1 nucleoside triphosphate pyrophosphohydrolase [Chloroflexota bacterium]MCI0727977.1 nucleoside triphosphate pyrophosphohydrolase [Chloroflexota bacterium]
MGIKIVGLGPGDGRTLTRQAWETLSTAGVVYLRTARHPAVADLPSHVQQVSFDHVYESAELFAQVYEQVAAEVLRLGQEATARSEDVVYAVPGHPFMGEATVTAVVAAAGRAGVPVTVIPGLSFVEPVLAALGMDGLDGLQLFDAIEIARYNHPPFSTDVPLLLGQVYSRLLASELKLVLMVTYRDEHEVFLVHAAGTEQQLIEKIPLYQLDRSPHLAHLTTLYVPPLPYPSSLPSLAETVAYLRGPEGCPWDREQTAQSLRSDFLEEVGEALDALDADDPAALCEELGDVLFHVVIQAQIASENGDFTLTDLIAGLDHKLKRRHPHVWGDWQATSSAEVLRNWEILKAQEREGAEEPSSLLDNIPYALPALARSQKIQGRVRKVGFDWPDISGVVAKLEEEITELRAAASPAEQIQELGDVLFALVNWSRWLGVDAESALREANQRFTRRFRLMEELAAERGLELARLDIQTLDTLWEEAKLLLLEDEADGG